MDAVLIFRYLLREVVIIDQTLQKVKKRGCNTRAFAYAIQQAVCVDSAKAA